MRSYSVEKNQLVTLTGNSNLLVSYIKEYGILNFTGTGSLRIEGNIEARANINIRGEVTSTIMQDVAQRLTLNHDGGGTVTFKKSVGENAVLILRGVNLTVEGQLASGALLVQTDSGELKLNQVGDDVQFTLGSFGSLVVGNVGQRAKFTLQGCCNVHFTGSLAEDVEFCGETCGQLTFAVPPSAPIAAKVQAVQNEALKSAKGFMRVAEHTFTMKKGPGWIRIREENGSETLYRGNRFELRDGVRYMDNYPVNPSLFTRINRFSEERPILFLMITLGLGVLWYIGKLVYMLACKIAEAFAKNKAATADNGKKPQIIPLIIDCTPSSTAGIARDLGAGLGAAAPKPSVASVEPIIKPGPDLNLSGLFGQQRDAAVSVALEVIQSPSVADSRNNSRL